MTAFTDITAFHPAKAIKPLHRPRSLVRAGWAGQAGWHRSRDLPRLLRSPACPPAGSALPRLRAEEERLNEARLERAPSYDMQRHVLVMIALLAEMAAADRPPVTSRGKASPARP
ncbi:DUF6477 family protein [Paracoccus methylarcula]|uniref:Uncharacterized protein n=1 Tax=Paracoccus methylarcula TaxID=72022 RepID=A0A3R7LQM8_9RHOB|nr:DUF6477 family protein [Paracoccus methylarcula]RNF35503.1 hypothetical protein A7A09_003470 [Paracoccus methylarcula]